MISVCLHEFGHAVVAYWGGDTSVKDKGYLTLNPLKYTDVNLSLILPIFFLLMGGIALPGAAVYINRQKLRNRWWQSAVSVAGPVASAIVTVLLAIPFRLGLIVPESQNWIGSALACLVFLQIYVVLFNSLPIPPLDGYGAIEPWLPGETQLKLRKIAGPGILFIFMMLWTVAPITRLFGESAFAIAQLLGVPREPISAGFAAFHQSSGVLLVAAIAIMWLSRRIRQKPQSE